MHFTHNYEPSSFYKMASPQLGVRENKDVDQEKNVCISFRGISYFLRGVVYKNTSPVQVSPLR